MEIEESSLPNPYREACRLRRWELKAEARFRAKPWGMARAIRKARSRGGSGTGSPLTGLIARTILLPTSCLALAGLPQACG